MDSPDPAEPAPVSPPEADMVPIVAAGTAVWVVVLIVLLVLHHALSARHDGWWVSVAATGVGLGVVGLVVSVRFRLRTGDADED